MKKTFSAKAILAAGMGLLIAGCVTPIADLEVTQFDRGAVKNTYGAEVAKKIKAKYAKKVHVTLAASEEATPAMAKHRDYLSDAITPALTALSYFKVSTTKNLGAIIKMNKTAEITGGETKNVSVEATDFMITYKLVSCDFVKNKGLAIAGSLAGSVAPAAGSVATELDTRAQAELNVSLVNV
ncbi:MAG: hypothetical protein J6C40_03165, partial [Lentisphaeria bacterium]|nr:hypothetical protein [Lentisphaeria bacterium]